MIKNLLYSSFLHIILLTIVYLNFTTDRKINVNDEEFLISAIIIETKTKKINIPHKPKENKVKEEKAEEKEEIIPEIEKKKEPIQEKPKSEPEPEPEPKPKPKLKPEPKKQIIKKELKKITREIPQFDPKNDIENLNLSRREKYNLKTHFKRCYIWATKESEYKNKIIVKFSISISNYGLIETNIKDVIDIKRYKTDKDYQKSFDNAARTIELCNPIRNLPSNKFDMLSKINIEIGQ
ncbi:MAG: hypothetical protein ISQ34_02010 [Rickettsiales bacterium]|nr:hypothetical protein [Rickettsiales bacterium]